MKTCLICFILLLQFININSTFGQLVEYNTLSSFEESTDCVVRGDNFNRFLGNQCVVESCAFNYGYIGITPPSNDPYLSNFPWFIQGVLLIPSFENHDTEIRFEKPVCGFMADYSFFYDDHYVQIIAFDISGSPIDSFLIETQDQSHGFITSDNSNPISSIRINLTDDQGEFFENRIINFDNIRYFSCIPSHPKFGPYCLGENPDILPYLSLQDYDGDWFPDVINTSELGAKSYMYDSREGCGIMIDVETVDCSLEVLNIDDPCNCSNPNNVALADGTYLFQDTLSVTSSIAPVKLTSNDGLLLNELGHIISVDTEFIYNSTKEIYELVVFTVSGTTSSVIISNRVSSIDFEVGPCAECNFSAIPTLGQWGVISLGLLLLIFGVVGIQTHSKNYTNSLF